MIQEILALMQDSQPRTSYAICDALYGSQPDGAKWYRVAAACDALVSRGKFVTCGKHEHRTVYMISETSKGEQ